ncbi:hypothetical protein PDESU_05564 [Pontiella desulfatans]|uniref:Periplasmic heavy metal sensor n=1 Tax=Pontiella desulfatans TaxID=2750659 RepID=A0A6C2UAA6_PONDE|nr:hypothetical protein [Pontiella desulfatans]VGO16970.1 hypothetical protein PDESU_05564 [Pontiella desulfatans]
MKSTLSILAACGLAIPAMAQTNEFRKEQGDRQRSEWMRGEQGGRKGEGEYGHLERYREISPEEKAERQERRLQLMEKTLQEIGINEEQKTRILEVQKKLKEDLSVAQVKADLVRKNLSDLEKAGASEEEIYAAIDAVSDSQAETMKILTRNRMAMERILGKEKYKQFMDAARNQYRKHGRRGGAGIPPRPGIPPTPGEGNPNQEPPLPDTVKVPRTPPPPSI